MSSVLSYIRKHATKATTTVTVEDGVTLRLTGMPVAYTSGGVASLAKSQVGEVKGSVRTQLDDGKRVSTSFAVGADHAANLVTGDLDGDAGAGSGRRKGGRQTAAAGGEPVPAAANGIAH